MVAALELGQIDVAPVTEPLWSKVKDKFRVLITGAGGAAPLDNVVGVATAQAVATRGDFIRRRDPRAPTRHRIHARPIRKKPARSSPSPSTSPRK